MSRRSRFRAEDGSPGSPRHPFDSSRHRELRTAIGHAHGDRSPPLSPTHSPHRHARPSGNDFEYHPSEISGGHREHSSEDMLVKSGNTGGRLSVALQSVAASDVHVDDATRSSIYGITTTEYESTAREPSQNALSKLIFGEKVHTKAKKTSFVGHDWGPIRIWLTVMQENSVYKLTMGILIVANIGLMTVETDMEAGVDGIAGWVVVLNYVFTGCYVFDVCAKIFSFRSDFFRSASNILDFLIVGVDVVTLPLAEFIDLPSVSILRTFRILRIVKVLNSVLAFRELYLMMQGLISALRSIAFGTCMIALLLTIWSILAVKIINAKNQALYDSGVYGECNNCREAFATVWRSTLTFMQTIIAGDSWGFLAVPLIMTHPETAFIIIPAFLTVELGLVNVIAAVIVDRQQQARVDDEALTHAEHLEDLKRSYSRLRALFTRMDEDGGGSLTLDELMEAYTAHTEFREMLEMMDISQNDIPLLFEILDTDDSGDVTYQEFVEKLHYIRHINAHTLLVFVQRHMEKIVKGHEEQRMMMTDLQATTKDYEKMLEEISKACGTKPHFEKEFTAGSTSNESDLQDSHPSKIDYRESKASEVPYKYSAPAYPKVPFTAKANPCSVRFEDDDLRPTHDVPYAGKGIRFQEDVSAYAPMELDKLGGKEMKFGAQSWEPLEQKATIMLPPPSKGLQNPMPQWRHGSKAQAVWGKTSRIAVATEKGVVLTKIGDVQKQISKRVSAVVAASITDLVSQGYATPVDQEIASRSPSPLPPPSDFDVAGLGFEDADETKEFIEAGRTRGYLGC